MLYFLIVAHKASKAFLKSNEDMVEILLMLQVFLRIKYNKAVLTYRALNNLTPEYISTLLKPISQVHSLNLRSADNASFYVPKSRTAICDGSFSCSASRLWNALHQTARDAGSLNES